MDNEPLERSLIESVQCDGLSVVHIDKAGVARVHLYAEQLEPDGEMCRILVSRLRMSREVMREIADQMLTASTVAAQAELQAVKERRRDAH